MVRGGRSQYLPPPPHNSNRRADDYFSWYKAVRRLTTFADPPAPDPGLFWAYIISSPECAAFFRNMDLGTYNSLRLVSRLFAQYLEPYTPGLHPHRRDRVQRLLGDCCRCQNVCRPGKTSVRQTHLPRPRTYHGILWRNTGAGPCTNTLEDIWQALLGGRIRPTMNICEGSRMGLNPTHAPGLVVCGICAIRAYDDNNFVDWIGEHKMPLCFECSTSHYGQYDERVSQLFWDKYCYCEITLDPRWSAHAAWLCDESSILLTKRRCAEWRQKLIDSNHPKRSGTDTQIYQGLGEYVHDGDD